MPEERCPGCGAPVPEVEGPTHPYMHSAPGCWELYSALGNWHRGLGGDQGITTVQNLVDAYAAQHATNPDRRNRQSVAVHLMSLCLAQEQGFPGRRRRALLGTWTHRDYPRLDPYPTAFAVTAYDVWQAAAPERPAVAARMAAATWVAWAPHHETVRRWLAARG